MAGWIDQAVQWLQQQQLARGEHVGSVMQNSFEWIVIDFACQLCGLVHVAIDPRLPDEAAIQLLRKADCRFAIIDPNRLKTLQASALSVLRLATYRIERNTREFTSEGLNELRKAAIQLDPLAPAQILFTSGTSGQPRAVVLSHRNLVSNSVAKLDAAPQFESDLRLNILPFSHAYARTCELSAWVLSKSELALAQDWQHFLHMAPRLEPTLINLVPHLVERLHRSLPCSDFLHTDSLHSDLDQFSARERLAQLLGSKVRLLQVGGAALPLKLWKDFAFLGLPPLQGYGLTEASPVVCSNRAGEQFPETVGPPVSGVEIKVDEDGQLWTRGNHVMLKYYQEPQVTKAKIVDGWLATGDIAELLPQGIKIIGRVSDVVVLSTGYKVMPQSIESRLNDIPWIANCIVVGDGDPSLTAVVWPSLAKLPAGLSRSNLTDERLSQEFLVEAAERLTDLPSHAQIRKALIANSPIDESMRIAKGGWRRDLIMAKYVQLES